MNKNAQVRCTNKLKWLVTLSRVNLPGSEGNEGQGWSAVPLFVAQKVLLLSF